MKTLGFIGIDQRGEHYPIKKHPRKELLEQLGRKHARKMHVDLKDGGYRHIGYVIGDLWINVYRIGLWKDSC